MLIAAPAPAPRAVAPLTVQVAYAGSGSDHTSYHSTPPNQGGGPDHDSAQDSSTQRWSLRFSELAGLESRGSVTLAGARGNVALVGHVDHVHIDGLYRQLNASAHCTLRYASARDDEPHARVILSATPSTVTVQVLNPIAGALTLWPSICPQLGGEPIDGLANNYFQPGYSPFVSGFGPDRWFTSARVTISRLTLARTGHASVRVGLTRAGTPPRNCDRGGPAYENCSFSGSWMGVVTVRVRRDTTFPARVTTS